LRNEAINVTPKPTDISPTILLLKIQIVGNQLIISFSYSC